MICWIFPKPGISAVIVNLVVVMAFSGAFPKELGNASGPGRQATLRR